MALGDNADFLLELARICDQQDDETGALRAASRALALRPMRADLLLFRANLYTDPATRDVDAAYRDLITGLRLEPADASAQHVLARVVNELTFDGWDAHKRGDENNALRLLDEASELAPSRDLEARRTTVLTSGFHGTAQELAALESAAKAAPHDFYSHERFDYALSLSRDWNRIGAMWGVYIAQNPEDGRAYYERAGTFANQQQMPAALADATRGCELGVSASCAFALQMSGRAK